MNWIKVQSSHVDALAYDADIQTLAVRYLDGAVYIRPNTSTSAFGEALTATSVGSSLALLRGMTIRIERGNAEPIGQSQGTVDVGPNKPASTGPVSPEVLNIIDENANDCCKKLFASGRPPDKASFRCPTCEFEYRARMEGPVRYWERVEFFAVHKRR